MLELHWYGTRCEVYVAALMGLEGSGYEGYDSAGGGLPGGHLIFGDDLALLEL